MMSKIFAFSLYFTSFLPLWIAILFIDIKSCIENDGNIIAERISISVIVITLVITIIMLLSTMRGSDKEGTTVVTIIEAKEEKTIAAEYLLSYILPLFTFDFTKWDSIILFLVFFLTLGFLCIKHNYFSVNIVLELAGFQFYSCEIKNEDYTMKTAIISHRKLQLCIGEDINLRSINNEYKLDVIDKKTTCRL